MLFRLTHHNSKLNIYKGIARTNHSVIVIKVAILRQKTEYCRIIQNRKFEIIIIHLPFYFREYIFFEKRHIYL